MGSVDHQLRNSSLLTECNAKQKRIEIRNQTKQILNIDFKLSGKLALVTPSCVLNLSEVTNAADGKIWRWFANRSTMKNISFEIDIFIFFSLLSVVPIVSHLPKHYWMVQKAQPLYQTSFSLCCDWSSNATEIVVNWNPFSKSLFVLQFGKISAVRRIVS